MIKIYHYIYYRTYFVISKTNKLSAESSSARLLSIAILLNVFTVFFFLKEPFNLIGFYSFLIIGIILSFLNLKYFMNEYRSQLIISEIQTLKVNSFWKYSIDIYPWLSILLTVISAGASYNTIFVIIGILIVLRLIQYFYEL
jgi:hypothetical protein